MPASYSEKSSWITSLELITRTSVWAEKGESTEQQYALHGECLEDLAEIWGSQEV